jgi:hypothetical protein
VTLPPTKEFMKNFAMEVLGYLLSPFFDDNDELPGIEIIDFSFALFFFFLLFYKGSPASCLGYNKLGEEINRNFGAFIWKPNNLFENLPYTKNTTYLERREKAYTINVLVRIHKYHK